MMKVCANRPRPPSGRSSTISTAAPLMDDNGVRSSIFNVPCASSVRVFVRYRQRQTLWSTLTIHGSPVCVCVGVFE